MGTKNDFIFTFLRWIDWNKMIEPQQEIWLKWQKTGNVFSQDLEQEGKCPILVFHRCHKAE